MAKRYGVMKAPSVRNVGTLSSVLLYNLYNPELPDPLPLSNRITNITSLQYAINENRGLSLFRDDEVEDGGANIALVDACVTCQTLSVAMPFPSP